MAQLPIVVTKAQDWKSMLGLLLAPCIFHLRLHPLPWSNTEYTGGLSCSEVKPRLLPSELISVNSLELSGYLEQAKCLSGFQLSRSFLLPGRKLYLSLNCFSGVLACWWWERVEEGDCIGRKWKSQWGRIETIEKQKLLFYHSFLEKSLQVPLWAKYSNYLNWAWILFFLLLYPIDK